MSCPSQAQAGLEYLLSYAWALVVVATVVATLVIISFSSSTEKVNFSAGGRQIVIKASNIAECAETDNVSIVLANHTGGQISISTISGSGSFAAAGSSATVNSAQPSETNMVSVGAGAEIRLEKISAACGAIDGAIIVNYTDVHGMQRSEEIKGNGRIKCCVSQPEPTGCTNGEQRDCDVQFGACKGAKETCTNGTWPGCNATTFRNWAAAKGQTFEEGTEISCANLQDNDCDNKFDCDDTECKTEPACSEIWCTTNDARFPVRGGIHNVMHMSGGCLYEGFDFAINDSAIFLLNLSGQELTISKAVVSLGPSHFEEYEATPCVFAGYFGSQQCPEADCEGIHYPGSYQEAFFITTINSKAPVGEACTYNVAVQNEQEIQIGTPSFTLCSNRPVSFPEECPNPTCPAPTEGMLLGHKDNPITITLDTNIGAVTVYCYNFPVGPCIDGQQRDCSTQFGVCAGAKETCGNGVWPGCTAANYGASYETTETSCTDLQDNDCDGKVDCDDGDCAGSDDCKIYATTYDFRFPVKGGITTAYMEVKGCIEVIDHLQSTTTPSALRLSPQADDNCTNWPIEGDTIYLKNLSGGTVTVNNASVSLGPSHFDDYTANSCAFFGRFASDRCPGTGNGDIGGFSEDFGVTSVNGALGSGLACNINTSIPAGEEIRVGFSDFSYCASRLPPECECSTDVLLRAHKDNPITITLNTNIGELNIYLYNFPTDS